MRNTGMTAGADPSREHHLETLAAATSTEVAAVTSPASALIERSPAEAQDGLDLITRALKPPKNQPCALEVCVTLISGIEEVLGRLNSPSPILHEWKRAMQALRDEISQGLGTSLASSHEALNGKRSKHPVWVAYAKSISDTHDDCASHLLFGCEAVLAFANPKQPVSNSLPKKLANLKAAGPWSKHHLDLVLSSELAEDNELNEGVLALRRQWAKVIAKFGTGQPPPPTTPNERIRSQVMSSALNASARHVAGALHHRLLSIDQFEKACGQVSKGLDSQTLAGALGVLVTRTGLAVDVAAQLPLGQDPTPDGLSCLDVDRGVAIIDLGVITHEASEPLPGAQPARHQLRVHLPLKLHDTLKSRLQQHPRAAVLSDLYPDSPVPPSDSRIYWGLDQIEPTWSRLRYALGAFQRHQGMNKLHAALLSGDFGIIPRSKLHYAVVTSHEFHALEQRVHRALGWGETVSLSPHDANGMGCAVVPEREHVRRHDQALQDAAHTTRPSKRADFPSLVRFHNAYTRLVGWRLAILLALRETTAIDLGASIDPSRDRWTPIHDKSVRQDRGFQPVPLCDYVAMTIRLYKEHCSALVSRLLQIEPCGTDVSRWFDAVGKGHNLRLLSLITLEQAVKPLASSMFTAYESDAQLDLVAPSGELEEQAAQSKSYALAPDVGRKVMENELRLHGARSSDVDAFLRHFTQGQEPASAFDPSVLSEFVRRISPVQQKVANTLLGPPTVGLSKGLVRQEALKLAYQ